MNRLGQLALVAVALGLWAPVAAADTQQCRTLVTWTRSGGFAGTYDTMKVCRDGSVTTTDGAFRITNIRLVGLRNVLADARFDTLSSKYVSKYPVSDGYTFNIRYGGKTVVVEQGANPPLRLQLVMVRLADTFTRQR